MRFNLHSHSSGKSTIHNAYLKEFEEVNGWFSLGIHPWYIPDDWKSILNKFSDYQQFVAIGECGLDRICATDWELQKEVFRAQIDLAEGLNKPLIIHCVKAYNECEQLLKNVTVPAVFHGFNKKHLLLKQLLRNPHFYFSFGEDVFRSSTLETIQHCPIDRLFIETDESELDIEEIYQKVAEIKKVSLSDLETQILLNRKKVFDL